MNPGAEFAHDGIAVRMGGREWSVPALNLRQLKRLAPRFALLAPADSRGPVPAQAGVGAGMTEEQIEALVEIAHAALSRNYPELTREQVSELVDLGNAARLMRAIVGASGLIDPSRDASSTQRHAQGRSAKAGTAEAPAGATSSSGGAVGEARAGASAPLGANASIASTGTA